MISLVEYAVGLSTVDNPYNPITDFRHWFLFDVVRGYNSCGYLDRIARTSDAFTDEENMAEIERAIDEIIAIDPFNIYTKVKVKLPLSDEEVSA